MSIDTPAEHSQPSPERVTPSSPWAEAMQQLLDELSCAEDGKWLIEMCEEGRHEIAIMELMRGAGGARRVARLDELYCKIRGDAVADEVRTRHMPHGLSASLSRVATRALSI